MTESSRSAHATSGETRIPVQRTRLARAALAVQLQQHLPAVLTVLAAGGRAITSERTGGGLALAAAELVVGVWVLLAIAGEARHLIRRSADHAGVPAPHDEPWIDVPGLAAAALGYVEVWHHAVARGHFELVSPFMLGATATLVLALGARRLIRRRMRHWRPHVLVTPAGLTYRGTRWYRWTAGWDTVASIEERPGEIVVHLLDGRTRALRAADHIGGSALIQATRSAIAERAPVHLRDARGDRNQQPDPHLNRL